jgi:hypothetical protein
VRSRSVGPAASNPRDHQSSSDVRISASSMFHPIGMVESALLRSELVANGGRRPMGQSRA